MNETEKFINGTAALIAAPAVPTSRGVDTTMSLWCAAFGVVVIAIVAGNSLFLTAFCSNRILRKQRNYLLVSLACADMLVGGVAIPIYICLVVVKHIENSTLMNLTEIYIAVDISTGLTSVFTLTVIALERLYAISFPLNYKGLKARTYILLVCVPWVLAGLLTIINIANRFGNVPRNVYTYSLAILTSLSLITIVLSYVIVWIKIKSHNQATDKLFSPKGRKSSEQERSLAVALFIVTVLFVTTWLPLHIMNIIVNLDAKLLANVSMHAVFFAKFLQYSNSFYNPIVYSLKIPDVKRSFKGVLRCNRIPETRV